MAPWVLKSSLQTRKAKFEYFLLAHFEAGYFSPGQRD
jgi:tmRNA-binding protein